MKLLAADDDPNLLNGLVELLSRAGFDCLGVGDGATALAAFRAEKPALCLLDVLMPGLDGLSLCREIRALDPRVPIILLSARDAEIDRVLGLEMGADDYIVKPFGPRELVARVKSALRRAAPTEVAEAGQSFMMGDLCVDPVALRAFRGSRAIDLSRREITVLQILFRRAGRPVARNDLLDLAWGPDFMPDSRALDQYISSLRRKIEADPAHPRLIRTVHGVGYRFDRPD